MQPIINSVVSSTGVHRQLQSTYSPKDPSRVTLKKFGEKTSKYKRIIDLYEGRVYVAKKSDECLFAKGVGDCIAIFTILIENGDISEYGGHHMTVEECNDLALEENLEVLITGKGREGCEIVAYLLGGTNESKHAEQIIKIMRALLGNRNFKIFNNINLNHSNKMGSGMIDAAVTHEGKVFWCVHSND